MKSTRITREEAQEAAHTLQFYMMQFEKDPIAYQLGHNSVITARIHIIQSTMEKMRKNYDAQWKELKKAGKVKKISKDEFIFV